MANKIKLLIVDDSLTFRKTIEKALESDDKIEVVGSVFNGEKAIQFINKQKPDVVSLDVEMPIMDGIETLRAIQKINNASPEKESIGVIMMSSLTTHSADITVQALEEGAFDYIEKPVSDSPEETIDRIKKTLIPKIKLFKSKRLKEIIIVEEKKTSFKKECQGKSIDSIVIGVSTGGPKALLEMLPELCKNIEVPIFIVQHMPPIHTQSLAKSLDNKCSFTVKEAIDGDVVQPKHIYIAPGGKHMIVRKRGNDICTELNEQPAQCGVRPSADVLFRSAAEVFKNKVIGIVLTGMGSDGTKGVSVLKRNNACVIVQDEASSVVWGMPGSAYASGNVNMVLPLMDIPKAIGQNIKIKG